MHFSDIEIVRDPSIKSFLTLEKLARVLERLNCKYGGKYLIVKLIVTFTIFDSFCYF